MFSCAATHIFGGCSFYCRSNRLEAMPESSLNPRDHRQNNLFTRRMLRIAECVFLSQVTWKFPFFFCPFVSKKADVNNREEIIVELTHCIFDSILIHGNLVRNCIGYVCFGFLNPSLSLSLKNPLISSNRITTYLTVIVVLRCLWSRTHHAQSDQAICSHSCAHTLSAVIRSVALCVYHLSLFVFFYIYYSFLLCSSSSCCLFLYTNS